VDRQALVHGPCTGSVVDHVQSPFPFPGACGSGSRCCFTLGLWLWRARRAQGGGAGVPEPSKAWQDGILARGSVCERTVLDGAQQRDPWASQVGRPRRRSWRKYDGEHRGGVGAYRGAWGSRVAVRWRVGAVVGWCGAVQATTGRKTIAMSSLAPATWQLRQGSGFSSSSYPLFLLLLLLPSFFLFPLFLARTLVNWKALSGGGGRMARCRWRGGSPSRLARLQAMAAHLLRRGEEGEAEMGGSVCGGWEG